MLNHMRHMDCKYKSDSVMLAIFAYQKFHTERVSLYRVTKLSYNV